MSIEHLLILGKALFEDWQTGQPNVLLDTLKKGLDIFKTIRQSRQRVRYLNKYRTHYEDLPNEIFLMICCYLTPIDVLKAFYDYNDRTFFCISEYRHNIDLTNFSYSDLQYFLPLFIKKSFQPISLTISNDRMPTQIKIVHDACKVPHKFQSTDVRHLSLIECTTNNLRYNMLWLKIFPSLQALRIVESTFNEPDKIRSYDTMKKLRDFMLNKLIKLELSINDGMILDKQMQPNKYLKQLTISLQTIDDLFILLDGLLPNLIVLNVTICQSNRYNRPSPPQYYTPRDMSHLHEFKLKTNENVAITFDHFRGIVMPLVHLEKFTIDVKKWFSHNEQFVQGNQIEMLINKFMPRLCYFHCSIQTTQDIVVQTFTILSKRWPMACRSTSDNLPKHLYTLPWSFEHLHLSMLAEDDTESICPNVQYLTIDMPCINLSHRFPNVHTLTVLPQSNLAHDKFSKFRCLRHLTVTNMEMISSPIARRIHTLRLSNSFELLNKSVIYPNVQHLILNNDQIDSLAVITTLMQYFPNLYSIKIQLKSNAEYYDSLNALLDHEYLPNLTSLKVNWIDQHTYFSDIQLWISANTVLKWKLTPFYGDYEEHCLTICL